MPNSERLLVLLRHGQSDWNLKNLFTGWRDPDLSPTGVEEAQEAGPTPEGARNRVRHRLHLGADPRPAHARACVGRDGSDGLARASGPGAERTPLRGSLRPQQGRRPQKMGRGAGPPVAPELRRSSARRREPEGYGGAGATLLLPAHPARGAAGENTYWSRRTATQPSGAGHGARPPDPGNHSLHGACDGRAAGLPAERRFDRGFEGRPVQLSDSPRRCRHSKARDSIPSVR